VKTCARHSVGAVTLALQTAGRVGGKARASECSVLVVAGCMD
jgi:hypothetical protein